MADYIYLLENRLSEGQKRAISTVREIARTKGLTIFLVGGAVRDLTSGSPVRDLDLAVQGNALKLKKDLQKAGAVVTGESEATEALFVSFPGGVRMEVGSTLTAHYPKPGKPVFKAAGILDDLRRRDFTANAMALSLNEGSYGLLMDPLNGVADIENRELRLASNYGFIEEPVRLIRAARFVARLGWQMEEKTRARYDAGKEEGYISALNSFHRGYEAEEIVYEEDPLRVMSGLEQEGWLKRLVPTWSLARVNVAEMEKLHEAQARLQMQGILADPSAVQFPLLTAKMASKDVTALKKSFARPGFVAEIEELESEAKKFAVELGSKQAATPSAAWKMLMAARPEVVLWVAYSTKNAGLQAKFQSFYTEWPQAKQRIPFTQMQEMRIVPELEGFDELVEKLFFELMDGRLGTVEEMKAFLEPYSPPAPPPPVHLRRARATKKDAKAKARKKAEEDGELAEDAEGLDGSEPTIDLAELGEDSTDEANQIKAVKIEKVKVPAPKAAATKPVAGKAASEGKAGSNGKVAAPGKTATPAKTAEPAKKATPSTKAAAPAKSEAKKAVAVKLDAKKPVSGKVVAAKVNAAKSVAGKAAAKKPAAPAKPAAKKPAASKSVAAVKKTAPAKAVVKKLPAKAVAVKPKAKAIEKASGKSGAKAVAGKAGSKAGAKAAAKTPAKSGAKVAGKASSAKKR
jgi:tRNA nucleotidyltransferase/poly(A) polymerase